jgi:dihydroorotate dehydrogenase (fumarate)
MCDISTTIGNIKFETPFMNASGCWCYSHKQLEEMNASESGSYITKTMTMEPRDGNPEPRYYHNEALSVNSMGLPNLGYCSYMDYALTYNVNRKKPMFFSISSMSYNNTKNMISEIPISLVETQLKGIEFNVSCPNIVGKGQMGYDVKQLDDFLNMVATSPLNDVSRNNLAVGLKMSPYFDKHQFGIVADVIKEYPRLDFITCINGIGNGLVIDTVNECSVIKPNGGCGGLGGSIVKPIGLSNVKTFKNLLGTKIDIIGCGGVTNAIDGFEYFLTGASAISVGTQLVKEGPSIFNRLNNEFKDIMKQKSYTSINDFKHKI